MKLTTFRRALVCTLALGLGASFQSASAQHEAAIKRLADAPLEVIDAPTKLAVGSFEVAVGNHVNGMARLGDWWIVNYPNAGGEKGRILLWNQNTMDYISPVTFDTEGGYPAGMDAAGPYLAVAHARDKVRFFQMVDQTKGTLVELASFDPPGTSNHESVGLAYDPGRQTYFMLLKTQLYSGTPGGQWNLVGTVSRATGYNESQPLVYLGNNQFAAFALGPQNDAKPYEFSFAMFTVSSTNVITTTSASTGCPADTVRCVSLKNEGEAGGAPSFRWAGVVDFDGQNFRMYASPKRLDSTGNYYYWTSPLTIKDYNVTVATGTVSGAGTDSNIFFTLKGSQGLTASTLLNPKISGNAFENGDVETATLTLADVGTVQSVTVRSDDQYPGSDWYLSYIDVAGAGRATFNRWIKAGSLTATANFVNTKQYVVTVKTGTRSGAGTDSNIFITINGTAGSTPETRLNGLISGDAFENGDTDKVTFTASDVGTITSIKIRSDDAYSGSSWDLSWVDVGGRRFNYGGWIDGSKKTVTLN